MNEKTGSFEEKKKIRCVISYDGSRFQGLQSQPHRNTIQDYLEENLSAFLGSKLRIELASRTDRGVHAYEQVIGFEFCGPVPVEKIPVIFERRLVGVRIEKCERMPQDWNIRNCRFEKEYWYKLVFGRFSPFYKGYAWCVDEVDFDLLIKALNLYQGTHDFFLLCKQDPSRCMDSWVRTIKKVEFVSHEDQEGVIKVSGDGFLWNQVRYMVSFALAVAFGKLSFLQLQEMLVSGKKKRLEKPNIAPAPADGLYLRSMRETMI